MESSIGDVEVENVDPPPPEGLKTRDDGGAGQSGDDAQDTPAAAPTSSGAAEGAGQARLLVSPRGYQHTVPRDLIHDEMLSVDNFRYFQRITKEMHDFTLGLFQNSRKKSNHLAVVEDAEQALLEKDRQLQRKNLEAIDARKELEWIKLERIQETWLLKNGANNVQKENAELCDQLKAQKKTHQDDVERLQKVLDDTDKQFAACLDQVKTLGEEKTKLQDELVELKITAQAVVDMVDPSDGDASAGRQLLDRLREAPQKIAGYISEVTKSYLTHGLGLVKSFWPKARLEVLAGGVAADYPLDKFEEYLEEVKPTAAKIVESLEQE